MRASLHLPVRVVTGAPATGAHGVLPGPHGPLTAEQARVVADRSGRLLVWANAGSGKTMVLVERFVHDVLAPEGGDPLEPAQILAITFTRKAAGELRRRIRERLTALGAREQARDLESAWISTIDGFCARVLRAHAVLAGLDPAFGVLEEADARAMREEAFGGAVESWLAAHPGDEALGLLAAVGYDGLRDAVAGTHERLRTAGRRPRIPLPATPDLDAARDDLRGAATVALEELRESAPLTAKRAIRAEEQLASCLEGLESGALADAASLKELRPPCQGALLLTPAMHDFREALGRYGQALCDARARPLLVLLDDLLARYADAAAAAKRSANVLDFTDLTLRTRDLLLEHPGVARALRARLRRVMVDEFQDTNGLQLQLLEAIGVEDLFLVGDALQSIYGFRHADVSVFLRARADAERDGRACSLADNFRSLEDVLAFVNAALGDAHGGTPYVPLRPGTRTEPIARIGEGPAVELLLTDERGWKERAGEEQVAAVRAGLPAGTDPAKAAEAQLVAQRVRDLRDGGVPARDIVVLVRAGTLLPVFERALEHAGVAAVAAQGRGWWGRLEVLDLLAHLRVLVNPRDEEPLFGALAAFAHASPDTLALLALDARGARGRDGAEPGVLGALRRACADDGAGPPPAIDPAERERLRRYLDLVERERAAAAWESPGGLLRRLVRATRYDEEALRRPGGARRLANVRKLGRLADEFAARHGDDLRAFVDHAAAELDARAPTSDAPIDVGEDEAVALMTIHAAKGLEFPVVVLADLGRGPVAGSDRVLVEGTRVGLSVTTLEERSRLTAFDYEALKEERAVRERAEERRIIHVAVTRAERLLVLSGAVDLQPRNPAYHWDCDERGVPPLQWMLPRILRGEGELGRLAETTTTRVRVERDGFAADVHVAVNDPRTLGEVLRLPAAGAGADAPAGEPAPAPEIRAVPEPAAGPPRPPATVSYTALTEYAACGYRWYLRRVLGLPPGESWDLADVVPAPLSADARARGSVVHLLLEAQAFGAGARPPQAQRIAALLEEAGVPAGAEAVADQERLVAAAMGSPLAARIAGAADDGREVSFALALDPADPHAPLLIGSIDVLATEPSGAALVVDWKSDRLEPDADLEAHVARDYRLQRVAYALAALRAGAPAVEVAHLFLDRPDRPVVARFEAADVPGLEAELRAACAGLLEGRYPVSERPWAGLCAACPGRRGLCSWPDDRTGAPAPVQAA